MADTPKLDMPEISASQAQKEVTHNEALRILDSLVQATVIDKDLGEPPGAPSDGDTYIVGDTPSSDSGWNGHEDDLAYYQSSAWAFRTPAEGWIVWVADENEFYVFDGSGWVTLLSILTGSLTGNAYKVLRVNGTEDGIQLVYEVSLSNLAGQDVCGFLVGQPTASQVVLCLPMTRSVNFPASLSGSEGKAVTDPAASAGATYSIKKDGVEFGTMTFASGDTVATFTGSSTNFAAGDVLTVVAPASPDADLADVGFTLKASRIN